MQSEELIKINRREDKGNDLWTVFNRVQENMLKGGTIIITPKEKGKTKSHASFCFAGKSVCNHKRNGRIAKVYKVKR